MEILSFMVNLTAFTQSDASRCGPSVIKMILYYYGMDVPEDEIAERCGHTYELGCDDKGMKKALESYGLAVEIYNNSTLEDIEYWMKFKIPIIVDWFSGGVNTNLEDMPNGHSGIIVGIDREKIYLVDPEFGQTRCIPRNDFLRVWFDWRSPIISSWEDMVIRQIIVPYPDRLKQK